MSTPRVAHPGYEIAEGVSTFGAPTMRVFDTNADADHPVAAAIESIDGWTVFVYRNAATLPHALLPNCALTARNGDDARAWLAFIGALYVTAAASLAGAA